MGLSNWDTYALSINGEPSDGAISDGEVTVEVYKNRLYVYDKKRKFPNSGVVATVQHGELSYGPFNILAKRSRYKEGIMALVTMGDYDATEGMIAIGAYGYEEDEFVGILPQQIEELSLWLRELKDDHDLPMEKIPDLLQGQRYNQGDAFFIGTDEAQTPVGQVKETVLSKIIKGMNDKETP